MFLKENRIYTILAGIILFYYLIVSLYAINVPGLYYDEAYHTPLAVYLSTDHEFKTFQYPGYFYKGIPIMGTLSYIGTVKSFFLAVIFKLFGPNIYSIRITTVMVAFFSIVIVYKFVSTIYNKKVAIITILFLATDVSQILTHRQDWGPVSFMSLIKGLSFLFLAKWWKNRKLTTLFIAFFMLGVGVWEKANYLWLVFALIGASILTFRMELLKRFGKKELIVLLTAFIIGSSPFLLFNINTSGSTFTSNLEHISFNKNSIYLYVNQAQHRLSLFKDLIEGDWITSYIFGGQNNQHVNWIFSTLFFIFLPLNLLFYKGKYFKKDLFFSLIFVMVLFQIFVTLNARGPHHFIMLYPFVHIIYASFLIKLFDYIKYIKVNKPIKQGVFYSVVLVTMLFPLTLNINSVIDFHRLGKKTGGVNQWSDAIFELAEYLKLNAKRKPVFCLDWGFALNLETLTNGEVALFEHYDEVKPGMPPFAFNLFAVKNGNEENIRTFGNILLLASQQDRAGNILFLRRAEGRENFKNVTVVYKNYLRKFGIVEKVEKLFYQKDKKEVFGVYSLSRIAQRNS